MGDEIRDQNTTNFLGQIDTIRDSYKRQIDDLFESFKQCFKVSNITEVFKFQLHQFQGFIQVQLNSMRQFFQQSISQNQGLNQYKQQNEKVDNWNIFDIPEKASSQIKDIFSRYQSFSSFKFQAANIHDKKLRIQKQKEMKQTPEQNFKQILEIIYVSGNFEDNLIILINEIYLRVSEANSQQVYFNNINPLNVTIRVFNEKISVKFGAPLILSSSMENYEKLNFTPKSITKAPEKLKFHSFSHLISPYNDIQGVLLLYDWIYSQVQVSHSYVNLKTYKQIMQQIKNTHIQKTYEIGEIISIKQQEKILQIQYYNEQLAKQNKLSQIQGYDQSLILCPFHRLILKYSKNDQYFCIRCLTN